MTGYQLKPRTRKVVFDETTEFSGLELEAHGITVGEWQELVRWPDILDTFAERLISWNLELGEGRKAKPVPPDADGFKLVEVDVLKSIALEWIDACTGVYRSGPLDPGPSSGVPLDAVDLEMEATMPMDVTVPNESATATG
jgi:hypothetical protein